MNKSFQPPKNQREKSAFIRRFSGSSLGSGFGFKATFASFASERFLELLDKCKLTPNRKTLQQTHIAMEDGYVVY